MKNLDARRDEQAKSRAVQIEAKQKNNPTMSVFENALRSYCKGFDSALAEVLPQVQRLVEALEKRYTNSVSPSGTANDAEIDSLLAEWRKFMGEG